jgi:hypothetical protein
VTELGYRWVGHTAPIEVSVLLKTEEASARVVAPVQVTRPALVQVILDACRVSTNTPGPSTKSLDDEYAAEAFRLSIEDRSRRHLYVVVSPTLAGAYAVEPARLASLLVGIAEVIVIPPTADSFAIADALGKKYSAWRGAVNILYPAVLRSDPVAVPSRRLFLEELEALQAQGSAPETEILSLAAHAMNRRMAWSHISPEFVQAELLQAEMTKHRREMGEHGDAKAYLELAEQDLQAKSREIASLRGEKDELDDQVLELQIAQDDSERRHRAEIDTLRAASAGSRASLLLREADGREGTTPLVAIMARPIDGSSLSVEECAQRRLIPRS